ncbi:metallophosphoesterase [Hyalangium minutum]|uniref:Calcineurin-like phosphoesterase n=1 Tax=Hyalangium minutum TaxID=394096 RepID=A0A085WK92_9BACT|nr:metallophosphoesterase [Hyalangium minutum]KFE68105.1 calcineurin-like phosphoesterase [Hyalangium minutum]
MSQASQRMEHEPQQDGVPLSQIPIGLVIRGLVAMLFAVSLVGALHGYIGLRLLSEPNLGQPWTAIGWTALWLLFFSIPLGFIASRRRPTLLNQVLYWTSMLWLGTFGLLLPSVLVADLVVGLWNLLGSAPEALALARGKAVAILAVVLPALAFAFLTARGRARIERLKIPVKKLGSGLHGVRVVQISDIHIGPTLDRHFLRRVVEQVNALQPDIIAVTGDLVDGSVRTLREEVKPLSELRAPLGVYYVTGNHEYYHGGAAWAAEVSGLGLTVLHNEHRVVERSEARLVVAGVTDHEGGRMDPAHACRPDLALAGAPEGVPRVLLAHQPRTAFLAKNLGVDLQLSGHTHGGQLFPFMFFVKLQQPVIRGLAHIAGVRVYTSRGTGYWGPPLRLGPAPEITELTLVAE